MGRVEAIILLGLAVLIIGCAINMGSGSASATMDKSVEGTNRVNDIGIRLVP